MSYEYLIRFKGQRKWFEAEESLLKKKTKQKTKHGSFEEVKLLHLGKRIN